MPIRYLLDTNVVSELRKPKPHGAVVAWLSRLQDHQLYISALTVGELQAGVERTRRQDPSSSRRLGNGAVGHRHRRSRLHVEQ